jgi:hypothetical protein
VFATAGSLAELYDGRELPARLVGLLRHRVWCDEAGEWVEQQDPRRVFVRPL